MLHHGAPPGGKDSQGKGREHEYDSRNRGELAEKSGGAPRTEERLAGAAEGCSHLGALPALYKHNKNQKQTNNDMKHKDECKHYFSF
jgi:hypothetical protein